MNSLQPWSILSSGFQVLGHAVAVMQEKSASENGLTNANGLSSADAFQAQVTGAVWELAGARILGYATHLPETNLTRSTEKFADIIGLDGTRIDLKGTQYPEGGLIVKTWHPSSWAYVLVTPASRWSSVLVCRGWVWGHEAQQPRWVDAPDPTRPDCYRVPQAALRSMETLAVSSSSSLYRGPGVPIGPYQV